MDIRQLSYFAAVVQEGTVTAAAQTLHLSQPPLSAQIHLLEQELGCELFDRSARRLRLTDAGRVLYERACGILTMCDSVRREMTDLQTGQAGILRLGVVSSASGGDFLEWLRSFRESGGRAVRLEMAESNTYQLLEQVRARQIELAFVRRPFSAQDLACRELRSEPLCALGREECFPLRREGPFLPQLAAVPLLLYRRWERIVLDAFAEQGLRPRVECVSDDARTVVSMARAGLGIGIAPRSMLAPEAGLVWRELTEAALQTELCAVWLREGYLSAAARRFLSCVGGREPGGAAAPAKGTM
jgi:DNA-binding transcriptional LysR family regulator